MQFRLPSLLIIAAGFSVAANVLGPDSTLVTRAETFPRPFDPENTLEARANRPAEAMPEPKCSNCIKRAINWLAVPYVIWDIKVGVPYKAKSPQENKLKAKYPKSFVSTGPRNDGKVTSISITKIPKPFTGKGKPPAVVLKDLNKFLGRIYPGIKFNCPNP